MDANVDLDETVMFGDSITQGAWSTDGLGTALANAYQRKLDVLNRGLSGYNSSIVSLFQLLRLADSLSSAAWALPVLQQVR